MKLDSKRQGKIYADLVLHPHTAESVLEEYDHGHKGYLTREEVLQLIKFQELKTAREVKGIVITLVVTKADLDRVLHKAEMGQKQKFKSQHLAPILKVWEEYAEIRLLQKQQSACCIVL